MVYVVVYTVLHMVLVDVRVVQYVIVVHDVTVVLTSSRCVTVYVLVIVTVEVTVVGIVVVTQTVEVTHCVDVVTAPA